MEREVPLCTAVGTGTILKELFMGVFLTAQHGFRVCSKPRQEG